MVVDCVLANANCYFKKTVTACCVAIDDGKIFKIGKEANMPCADIKVDLKHQLVLPGLIDAHVHLRDECKAIKEDFLTGTSAAAAGGFTTVLDMPNNEPVTMSVETLRNRMKLAENRIVVDVGFRSEFPRNIAEIGDIVSEGIVGFKLFMADQIGGLDISDDDAMREAFGIVAKFGVSTAVHAEDADTLKKLQNHLENEGKDDVSAFSKAHTEDVELRSLRRVLSINRQVRMHSHFCHVSTTAGLEAIVEGKKLGLPVTCEVTPHHLLLSSEDLKRVGMTAVTMPPVRENKHILALWGGVSGGAIDIIASDHAPHALKEKEATSIWEVKVGIPGLETTLPLLLTEVKRGRLSIGDLVRLMSENPAKIFGLRDKGILQEGATADLTVVDLRRRYRIDSSEFLSKAKYSPFDRREVEGKPVKTFVGGQLIMDEGSIVAKSGSGRVIRRERRR